MTNTDPDFERLKEYDFADAKPASTLPHLAKHQLERQHRLNLQIDDDLAVWLSRNVEPGSYEKVLNAALREFKKRAA